MLAVPGGDGHERSGWPRRRDPGAGSSLKDPWRYRIPAGCGAKILGVINGVLWETDLRGTVAAAAGLD
jgi:hypothetical protein